jgi:hypothetical protein
MCSNSSRIISPLVYYPPRAFTGPEKRIAEGKLKDPDKMFMRLGRIQASHPQVADLYENGDQGQQEGMTSR